MQPSALRRILVLRPDRIGDVVCITPSLRAIRDALPKTEIGVLTQPRPASLLKGHPCVDCHHVDDDVSGKKGMRHFLALTRQLATHRYDAALLMLPTARHTYMTFLAGIPIRISVGWKPYQFITGCRMVSRHKYIPLRHESEYCLDLVSALGIPHSSPSPELTLTETERRDAHELLMRLGWDGRMPLVSLHPESGHSSPNWTHEDYRRLVDLLAHHTGLRVLVHLPPQCRDLAPSYAEIAPETVLLPDDEGDLRLLMGWIEHAQVVVSSSTGPMHLAAALKRPTVSLFCPLTACSPVLWGPRGNPSTVILPPDEYCAQQCPGDPHICTMHEGILPETVCQAILDRIHGK